MSFVSNFFSLPFFPFFPFLFCILFNPHLLPDLAKDSTEAQRRLFCRSYLPRYLKVPTYLPTW